MLWQEAIRGHKSLLFFIVSPHQWWVEAEGDKCWCRNCFLLKKVCIFIFCFQEHYARCLEHKISLDISVDSVYPETIKCTESIQRYTLHILWITGCDTPLFAVVRRCLCLNSSPSLSSPSLSFWKWRAGVQLKHNLCFRNPTKACSDVGSISPSLPGMQEPQTSHWWDWAWNCGSLSVDKYLRNAHVCMSLITGALRPRRAA